MATARGKRNALACAVVGCAWLAAGCGPIEYVNQVTRKASSAVDAAESAEADKYSPYFYTLAVQYLHKAREEAAAADYQAANRFGRKAEQAAKEAKKEALDRAGKPIEQFYPNLGDKAKGDSGGGDIAPLGDDDDDDDASDAPKDKDDSSDGDDSETPPGVGTSE